MSTHENAVCNGSINQIVLLTFLSYLVVLETFTNIFLWYMKKKKMKYKFILVIIITLSERPVC